VDARSKRLRIRGLTIAGFFIASFFSFASAIFVLLAGGGFSSLSRRLEDRVLSAFLWGLVVGLALFAYPVSRFVYDVWSSRRRTRKVIG
jgi:hypothetical protein